MSAANIDSQFVVDEHPNVVVSADAEFQAFSKAEVCMGFGAEVQIAATILFTANFGCPARSL